MRGSIAGVYYIRNTHNGRMYIGQASNILARMTTHRQSLRLNRHVNRDLQADWNTYGGAAFEYGLLAINRHDLSRRKLESDFIREYKSNNPALGYNCNYSERYYARVRKEPPL